MSTYIKPGKPLEYDNAPDWLVAFLRYERAIESKSVNTVKSYFLALRSFFQWFKMRSDTGRYPRDAAELHSIDILALPLSPVVEISKSDIEAYLDFESNVLGNSPGTRNQKLAAIRAFFYYVLDHQKDFGVELASNPADRIKKAKLPKTVPAYFSKDDLAQMLDVENKHSIRDQVIILLFTVSGMRVSELVGLNTTDINLKTKRAKIRSGKGAKDRIVVLTDNVCEALEDYIALYRSRINGLETNAFFVSSRTKDRLSTRAVQKMVKKQGMKKGLYDAHPHAFRHTTGTSMAQENVDVLTIQLALGHESPTTTAKYVHIGENEIERAVQKSYLSELAVPDARSKEG